MRIARFVRLDASGTAAGQSPRYGLIEGDPGDEALAVMTGDPLYPPVQVTGERIPLAEVRLLAPVIPRSKVIGIGRNYADHAAELGNEPPPEPLIFLKPNTSVIGPDDPVLRPRVSSQVDYEGELAVVIGRLCKDVPRERVDAVVLGYTCGNDVTARDLQRRDGQWARAKGFDSFCPLGPWIVTDLDVSDLRVTTRLDGVTVQDARTSDLLFDVPTLVAHASSAFTLLPGDVILTGTPAGVGPMVAGQRVEVEIEGIGVLANPVADRG